MRTNKNNKANCAFTMIEVVVAASVFGLVSLLVLQFTRWSVGAQDITTWKQSANDAMRMNEIFWQEQFAGATHRLKPLNVKNGILQSKPEIDEEPLLIRSGGVGDLMADYSASDDEWVLWEFSRFRNSEDEDAKEESRVLGVLEGDFPNVKLYGKIVTDDKVVRQVKLLDNLTSINGSVRKFPQENINILDIEYVVAHPRRAELQLIKQSSFRISTTISSL